MNIVISDKLFRKLIEAVCDLERELEEAQSCCTLQEDIDSLEGRLIYLDSLGKVCRRIEKAAKHGRAIKGQAEPITITEGQLAQLRRRK